MKAALLPDRGVVKVNGDDARKFLNGLVTSDIAKGTPEAASFAALLTPQGKVIVDFILAAAPHADGRDFFLDCPRALAPTLLQRLNFYKLRAKVIVEDLSETLGVLAIWDGSAVTEYGFLCPRPPRPTVGAALHAAPAPCGRSRGRRRRRARRAVGLRGPSNRARRPARRPRLHLRRCVPARDRHGSVRRRRLRQGLLRRTGGGVGH